MDRCTAKSTRWVRYGGEANRDAENRKAQRASADRSESNGHAMPWQQGHHIGLLQGQGSRTARDIL